MSGDIGIGRLIAGGVANRDAIHVAVAPVIAAETLNPGEHIGFDDDGYAIKSGRHIGIVDPFLTEPVLRLQAFYLFLYPGSITSLRHDWHHPAFEVRKESSKAASEEWLREFCRNNDCPRYEILMAGLRGQNIAPAGEEHDGYYCCRWDDEYLHFGGYDAHSAIPYEFWEHVEVVLGIKIPDGRRSEYFSCSC